MVHAFPNNIKLSCNSYSIISLPIPHGINQDLLANFTEKKKVWESLVNSGWELHTYLSGALSERNFDPESIFNKEILDTFLGERDCLKAGSSSFDKFIKLLNNHEPILLSNQSIDGLDKVIFIGRQMSIAIKIHWIDLLLFPEGLALLSFKISIDNKEQHLEFNDFSQLNREIRFCNLDLSECQISVGSDKVVQTFWKEFVFKKLLGFENSISKSNVINYEVGKLDYVPKGIKSYTLQYAKIFTVAEIIGISEKNEFSWNAPITKLDRNFHDGFQKGVNVGEINLSDFLYHDALRSSYPSYLDILAFELASVSNLGTSIGGDKRWSYSLDYLKKISSENKFQVFNNWVGFALRDVVSVVTFQEDRNLLNQSESRFFPLYLYTLIQWSYFTDLASLLIDKRLNDVLRGRKLKERFQKLRSKYWFREPTSNFLGTELYDSFQFGLKVESLYKTVFEEISDVSEFLQQKWDRFKALAVAVLIILLAPIQWIWDNVINRKLEELSSWEGIVIAISLPLVGIIAILSAKRIRFIQTAISNLYKRFVNFWIN